MTHQLVERVARWCAPWAVLVLLGSTSCSANDADDPTSEDRPDTALPDAAPSPDPGTADTATVAPTGPVTSTSPTTDPASGPTGEARPPLLMDLPGVPTSVPPELADPVLQALDELDDGGLLDPVAECLAFTLRSDPDALDVISAALDQPGSTEALTTIAQLAADCGVVLDVVAGSGSEPARLTPTTTLAMTLPGPTP